VLTHTRPWPPPGAGVFVAASVLAPLAVAGLAAAGLAAAAEVFGLNKSPRLNLAGDADAAGLAAASAFLRVRFALGEAAGDAAGDGDTAGLPAVAASAFLRPRLALGEAAGDSAVEGDPACSAGEAAAAVFLCVRCFAGEGDGAGEGD
jgi:hypothetical protein